MGKLILVRHGESELNKAKCYCGVLDPNLTQEGIEQCKKTREILKEYDYDFIYSSTLKRAKQTAEIINHKNLEIIEDKNLIEKNFGIFEGLTSEEILETSPKEAQEWYSNPDTFDYKIGEDSFDFHNKIVTFAQKTLNTNKNILLVSHWGVVNTLLSHYIAGDKSVFWKFSLSNAGFAILDFNEHSCVLSKMH